MFKKIIITFMIIIMFTSMSYAFEPEPIIQQTIDAMAEKGFDGCEISIIYREGSHGHYNYVEDWIGLYPFYNSSKIQYREQCAKTFLHEYGHHIWFAELSDEQRQQYTDSREWSYEGYFDNPIEMWAEEWGMVTGLRNGIYFKRHNFLQYKYKPVLDIIDSL